MRVQQLERMRSDESFPSHGRERKYSCFGRAQSRRHAFKSKHLLQKRFEVNEAFARVEDSCSASVFEMIADLHAILLGRGKTKQSAKLFLQKKDGASLRIE